MLRMFVGWRKLLAYTGWGKRSGDHAIGSVFRMLIPLDFFKDRKDENEIILEEVVWFFEDAWKKGQQPKIEDYLPSNPDIRCEALRELACVDLERRLKLGEERRVEGYLERFPAFA